MKEAAFNGRKSVGQNKACFMFICDNRIASG